MDDKPSNPSLQPVRGTSRRDFLKFAAILAGSVGMQGLPRFNDPAYAVDVANRGYAAGHFGFELQGQFVDYVRSFEGGFAKADVVQEKLVGALPPKKHLANIKYADIIIQIDPALPRLLADWITQTLTMRYSRKDGSIITTDFDYKEISRLDFFHALISEVTIPSCDIASKDPGYLTVKFAPEYTRVVAGKGGVVKGDVSATKQQKVWLPSNFQLRIQGLEEACARITKIEAITFKQKIAESAVGELRDYEKAPASFELSNLVMYVPEIHAGPFFQWFDDFVVKGNSSEDKERPGFLELLSPDRKTVLLHVNFSHLGICGFAPEKRELRADRLPLVRIEMYCEQITLDTNISAPTPPSPPQGPPTSQQLQPMKPGGLVRPPLPLR